MCSFAQGKQQRWHRFKQMHSLLSKYGLKYDAENNGWEGGITPEKAKSHRCLQTLLCCCAALAASATAVMVACCATEHLRRPEVSARLSWRSDSAQMWTPRLIGFSDSAPCSSSAEWPPADARLCVSSSGKIGTLGRTASRVYVRALKSEGLYNLGISGLEVHLWFLDW